MNTYTRIKTEFARTKSYYLHVPSSRVSNRILDLVEEDSQIDTHNLAWFLAVGFVPGEATLFKDIICLPGGADIEITPGSYKVLGRCCYQDLITDEFLNLDEKSLVKEGLRRLRSIISRLYKENSGDIVVPISGGMDSRAILGGLLEHQEAKYIHTYTFGTPGTSDFELGCQVAKFAGTNHTIYDLTKYKYTPERLALIADLSNLNTNVFRHAPYEWILRDFGESNVSYWIGYLGDPSTGSHIPNLDSLSQWRSRYCLEWCRKTHSIKLENILTDSPDDLTVDLQKYPYLKSITREELWDLENRQERWIASAVLLRGLNYTTPFAEKEWLSYALSLPMDGRTNQKLYKKMLWLGFPPLFSIPVYSGGSFLNLQGNQSILSQVVNKSKLRKVKHKLKKLLNIGVVSASTNKPGKIGKYIDFNTALQRHGHLYEITNNLLLNLEKRKLFDKNSIQKLQQQYAQGVFKEAEAITILASFEIILETIMSSSFSEFKENC